MTTTRDQARAAKAALLDRLAGALNIAGVGITTVPTGFAVKLNLTSPVPPELQLPDQIDGVPMVVEVVGRVKKRMP